MTDKTDLHAKIESLEKEVTILKEKVKAHEAAITDLNAKIKSLSQWQANQRGPVRR